MAKSKVLFLSACSKGKMLISAVRGCLNWGLPWYLTDFPPSQDVIHNHFIVGSMHESSLISGCHKNAWLYWGVSGAKQLTQYCKAGVTGEDAPPAPKGSVNSARATSSRRLRQAEIFGSNGADRNVEHDRNILTVEHKVERYRKLQTCQ